MLTMRYELADLPEGMAADAREWEGAVAIRISRACKPEELVAALNAIYAKLLAGGQWFQIWGGRVISNRTDEQGDSDGGIPRGPVV